MGKSKKESGVQDKSQICENFIDSLFKVRTYYSHEISYININSIRNKFDMLTRSVTEYIDILLTSETRLDSTCFI